MNKQYISNDLADKTLHLKLMNMRKSIILLAFILGGFTVANVQSPNQKIPDRKTKCVIKTHINIKQNVIFGAKLKPV